MACLGPEGAVRAGGLRHFQNTQQVQGCIDSIYRVSCLEALTYCTSRVEITVSTAL